MTTARETTTSSGQVDTPKPLHKASRQECRERCRLDNGVVCLACATAAGVERSQTEEMSPQVSLADQHKRDASRVPIDHEEPSPEAVTTATTRNLGGMSTQMPRKSKSLSRHWSWES